MHHKCHFIKIPFFSPTSDKKSAHNKWSISITHRRPPKSTSNQNSVIVLHWIGSLLPLGKNPTPHAPTHHALNCVTCLIFIKTASNWHGLPNSTHHLDPMFTLHMAQNIFLETIRFMWVHQFKIPTKTRGLSIANLWCKEFGHSFLPLVPNKILFFSRVGNSFIQVYDQIWITWDWVHVVVVLKVSTGTPCFVHLGDEISKESEKEHTGGFNRDWNLD